MNRLYCFIILTSSCINASVLTPTNTIPVFIYYTYYNSCCTIPIQRSILHSISIQAISYGTHAHLKETYEPNLFLHQKNRLLQRCIKTIHGSRHKLLGIKLTLANLPPVNILHNLRLLLQILELSLQIFPIGFRLENGCYSIPCFSL